MPPRYIVISPVRNEEDHLPSTIRSMVSQTVRPIRWILVDDGSTDRTPELLQNAAREHSWITTIRRQDRGHRSPGTGVIEAFYDGYAQLEQPRTQNPEPRTLSHLRSPISDLRPPSPTNDQRPGTKNEERRTKNEERRTKNEERRTAWDFLVKLDGDLTFEPDYFEQCLARFGADPKLGIGGGTVCCAVNSEWIEESKVDPPFHVRGATKIYRRACWEAIGGLLKAPGWDTLDEVKANMLGWRTYSFKEIKLLQLKGTGTADGGWRNWFKNGRANYIVGYHPLFMLSKCASRLFQPPYFLAAFGLLCGFLTGYLRRLPQIEDAALIRYLRGQQWRRLTARPSLWTAARSPVVSSQ